MSDHGEQLRWIETQRDAMCARVASWSAINSGSYNVDGLSRMAARVSDAVAELDVGVERIDVSAERTVDVAGDIVERPLGGVVHAVKRPDAPVRVFLGCHYDTVFAADDPFQRVSRPDPDVMCGPGVVDAKGGIVVMLTALAALERSANADAVGWEILVNGDEEIASPGSATLLAEAAARNHMGLVYEPALPDGSLAGARKGSGNFAVVVRGRSAHAGRAFDEGRSAVVAAAKLVVALDEIGREVEGATVNTGRIEGGAPVNVVPDLAIVRLNARVWDDGARSTVERRIAEAVAEADGADGISASLHGEFRAPPRPLGAAMQGLLESIAAAGRELGVPVTWHPTGGVCDGNRLSAAGLPTVDTLGARGGGLHSSEEFLVVDSLVERAQLSALLLLGLADGAVDPSAWSDR